MVVLLIGTEVVGYFNMESEAIEFAEKNWLVNYKVKKI